MTAKTRMPTTANPNNKPTNRNDEEYLCIPKYFSKEKLFRQDLCARKRRRTMLASPEKSLWTWQDSNLRPSESWRHGCRQSSALYHLSYMPTNLFSPWNWTGEGLPDRRWLMWLKHQRSDKLVFCPVPQRCRALHPLNPVTFPFGGEIWNMRPVCSQPRTGKPYYLQDLQVFLFARFKLHLPKLSIS